MYKDTIGKAYVKNGQLFDMENIKNEDVKDKSIYEVIRMVNGIPLFMEDHILRLATSANLMGYDIKDLLPSLFEGIGKMILGNDYMDCNFKILISNNEEVTDYICFFIQSHYPEEELYENGVPTILYFTQRENPNAKSLNLEYKANIKKALDEANAYEALLVNEKDFLTEGSRSNLFIISEGCVYTAPSKDVLLGITRQKIVQLCKKLLIPLIETEIHVDILSEADGVFITGTSPKVLPVSTINGDPVGSPKSSILKKIMAAYDQEIKEYMDSYTL